MTESARPIARLQGDNAAIVAHVRSQGSCSYAELAHSFNVGEASCQLTPAQFRKKLEYLLYHEKLQSNGAYGPRRCYSVGKLADPAARPLSATASAIIDDRDVDRTLQHALPRVPPRQFDVMHGPLYVPTASGYYRPGAHDHQRYASRGHQC